MSGYVTSGRLMADSELETAMSYRRSAHLLFRWGHRYQGRDAMRQALRAWRRFRYYRARIH